MPIFQPTDENLTRAAEYIQNGDLVSFATETVYGLGANALDVDACEKIFTAKERPHYDPLIVHIASTDQIDDICSSFPENAQQAAAAFWPGSLTMILPKKAIISDSITANLPTVAVRVPNHPVARALLKKSQRPIAAPSANPFGYLSPTTAEHVEEQLGGKIPMILDGGECACGVESTIVDFTVEPPQLLRYGGLSQEELEEVCGTINPGQAILEKPLAPGQLASHYSPKTDLQIIEPGSTPNIPTGKRCGLLTYGSISNDFKVDVTESVSTTSDLNESAHNLFAALHRLDHAKLDIIYAHSFPEQGIGCAIMDRLRKAAVKLK